MFISDSNNFSFEHLGLTSIINSTNQYPTLPTKSLYQNQENFDPVPPLSRYHPGSSSYSRPILARSRSVLQQDVTTNPLLKCPPCITVGLRPQLEVFESDTPLEFKIIYLGDPLPLVTWKKNGVPLTNLVKSKPNCSILNLDSIKADDAGEYSCIVENSEGSNLSHFV